VLLARGGEAPALHRHPHLAQAQPRRRILRPVDALAGFIMHTSGTRHGCPIACSWAGLYSIIGQSKHVLNSDVGTGKSFPIIADSQC
jgi:hypothetical protein